MNKSLFEKFKHNKSSFEAIILNDGTVIDANGDYFSELVDMISKKYSISAKMVAEICPYSHPMEVMGWLCIIADALCINSDSIFMFSVSEAQIKSIKHLKDEGLYVGEVPYSRCN